MKDFKHHFLKKPLIYIYLLPGLGMVGYRLFKPVLPIFARRLGASGFEVGLLTSGFMLARAFTSFGIGKIIDSSGRRKPFIVVGFIIVTILTLLLYLSNSFNSLLIIRFFMGMCAGLIWPPAQVMVVENADRSFRTRALSLYQISGKTGILLSRAFLSLILLLTANAGLEEMPSFRVVFVIASVVMFFCFLETFMLPDIRKHPVRKNDGRTPYSIFLLGFVFGAMIALDPIFYIFINEHYSVAPVTIAVLLLFLDFLGIIAVYAASYVTDKMGFNRSCWFVIVPAFTSAIIISFMPNLTMVLVIYFLMRISVSSFIPISRSYAAGINESTGSNLGTLNMMSNLGAVTGPLVGGYIFDKFTGNFRLAGYSFIGLFLVPAVLFYLFSNRSEGIKRI